MEYQLGLIGYPLDHSLSPRIHTYFLKACNLQGNYNLFPIPNDDTRDKRLQELMERMSHGEIHGFNVTIPHKQSVLPFMNQLTMEANCIQAVNTVYWDGTKLIGANTDVGGFMIDLKRFMKSDIVGNALVLGAGGAGRAVVYALLQLGWNVCIAARRVRQADELRNQLIDEIKIVGLRIPNEVRVIALTSNDLLLAEKQNQFQLIVNTTPLGMAGHPQTSPLPEDFPLTQDVWVYDLVYNPPETVLLAWARAKGAEVANGLGMLIEQARLAFELWTGERPMYTDDLLTSLRS